MMRSLFVLALLFDAGAAAGASPAGKRVFDRVCAACHVNDLSSAPQVKKPAMWEARVAKGRDALHASALNGFVGPTGEEMPARGGQLDLSDAEVKSAVDYIIETLHSTRK